MTTNPANALLTNRTESSANLRRISSCGKLGSVMRGLAVFVACAAPFVARATTTGLTESVWYGITLYQFSPSPQDITQEQADTAARTPDLSFVNTGSPLSDYANYASSGYVALDANGFIYAPVAGTYTFDLGHVFNQVDDAARVTIDGAIVAEQNFGGNYLDHSGALNLSAGYHSFDLFYFQTIGGYNFSLAATGPNGSAIDYTTTAVPDGGMTAAFLGSAMLGLAALRRKLGRA